MLWSFSNLRFQAEMAQLLTLLMIVNMLGAIIIVPTFYSILRPRVATALLSDGAAGSHAPAEEAREEARSARHVSPGRARSRGTRKQSAQRAKVE